MEDRQSSSAWRDTTGLFSLLHTTRNLLFTFSFLTTQELCWLLGHETPFLQAGIWPCEWRGFRQALASKNKCTVPWTVQLTFLYLDPLYCQLLACRIFLSPLCSLTSVIQKLTLWLSQVPRNQSNPFLFPLFLWKFLSAGPSVNREIQWLSTAGLTLKWKRWGTLSAHCAFLAVAKIKSIVSCAVGCCLQKQGEVSPCSNHFAENIRLEVFSWLHKVFETTVMFVCTCLLETVG